MNEQPYYIVETYTENHWHALYGPFEYLDDAIEQAQTVRDKQPVRVVEMVKVVIITLTHVAEVWS